MHEQLKVFQNFRGHPFLRIGAGVAIFLFGIVLTDIPTMIMSSGWPATEGIIVTNRLVGTSVREWTDNLYTERYAYIRYQYFVNGSLYSSSAVNSINPPLSWYPPSYANQYPVGKSVMVYYNPRDPSEAVLEPGFVDVIKTFDVISLSFFGAGIYFIFLGIKGMKMRDKTFEYVSDPEFDA
jgi:hypothetical protein